MGVDYMTLVEVKNWKYITYSSVFILYPVYSLQSEFYTWSAFNKYTQSAACSLHFILPDHLFYFGVTLVSFAAVIRVVT